MNLSICVHRAILCELVVFYHELVNQLGHESCPSLSRVVLGEGVSLDPSAVG